VLGSDFGDAGLFASAWMIAIQIIAMLAMSDTRTIAEG